MSDKNKLSQLFHQKLQRLPSIITNNENTITEPIDIEQPLMQTYSFDNGDSYASLPSSVEDPTLKKVKTSSFNRPKLSREPSTSNVNKESYQLSSREIARINQEQARAIILEENYKRDTNYLNFISLLSSVITIVNLYLYSQNTKYKNNIKISELEYNAIFGSILSFSILVSCYASCCTIQSNIKLCILGFLMMVSFGANCGIIGYIN
jgi:hypothetical protein